jgi:hypothetical protein
MYGGLLQQTTAFFAELGIADMLIEQEAQTLSVAELARRTGVEKGLLRRMLRLTTIMGLTTSQPDDNIGVTALGRLLSSNARQSRREWAMWISQGWRWDSFRDLPETMRTGQTMLERQGTDFYEHLAETPEQYDRFLRGQIGAHRQMHQAVAAAYETDSPLLIDVGGGYGTLTEAFLQRHPTMRSILFDVPDSAAQAIAAIQQAGLSDRCIYRGGNFFESVPTGESGTIYALSCILHNWNDEHCVRLLQVLRAAMQPDNCLLIIEPTVLEAATQLHRGIVMDMFMVCMHGGRERSLPEHDELLQAAGFTRTHTIQTAAPAVVFEAKLAAP